MKKLTQWERLVELINSTEYGNTITRIQVLQFSGQKKITPHSFYSIDSYRRILECNHVLVTKKPGIYIVVNHEYQNYNQARKDAYGPRQVYKSIF